MKRVSCTCISAALLIVSSLTTAATELDLLPLGDPQRAHVLASVGAGGFFDCRAGRELSLEELAAELVQARVVLIGEEHTNMEQKLFHARLLEEMALLKGELVLGMEFFLREEQGLLNRWSEGEIDTDALLLEVGWYDRGGYRFEYYQPIMDVARAENIRVVGLNVPRDIPRAVNRGGLAGLSDEQRELVGEVTTDGSPAHRYLIGRYFGETVAMLPPGWFDNMYSAQCLWDVVMARSILANLEAGETMVVIVGSGHVAYDLGIGRRIHEELSSSSQSDVAVATFCPVTAPPPDPEGEADGHPMGGHGNGMAGAAAKPARFVRSLSDYVGVFSDTGGVEAFPRVGLRLDEGDDGNPVVSMAWPDTPAAAAGFEHGDRIVSFNGHPTANLTELRLQLAETTWGQRVDFGVEREEETLEIPLLLYPEVDLTEDVTAPGFSVEAALEVDPLSSEAVAADTEAAERPRAVLVSKGSAPLRVEVWHGDVLEAVHELDSSGRVERSLHRMPRSDGAVELRYRRDELGNVTEVERLDAIGESIGG